jgi:hypothetical protein
MTVKTNNAQKGGGVLDAAVRRMNNEKKPLYESVKKRINNKVELYEYLNKFIKKVPCFPDLEEVTPMTTYEDGYFIKSGKDLLHDIQVAIQYAKCKNCEHEYESCNYQDCTLRYSKCHIDQFCSHTYGTSKRCFLMKYILSFDEYQLAWHFDILSNEGYYNLMYLHKEDYPKLVRRIGWKYPNLPKNFNLLDDSYKTSYDYIIWKDLYKLVITDSNSSYGGKKSRKSRNKKRKSNKKKRKTVKKRRLRKQK